MRIFDFQVKSSRMGSCMIGKADWTAGPRDGEARA
jgi:hypothetical protein